MPAGLFITFEGTEGAGKSTQVEHLRARVVGAGRVCRVLREPGGTALGEEIRVTLKHSPAGCGMVPEAELLLFNASRAQLVREAIRPALAAGEVVLCDRFYDSTVAYQVYGRGLAESMVRSVIHCAVGDTRPHLTLLFTVSPGVAEARLRARQGATGPAWDRMEAAEQDFFARVEQGFAAVARQEPGRIQPVEADDDVACVAQRVWDRVCPWLERTA